ncbi:hypothetical protein MLD38_018079 [Melastoma candidum]|uniref:Uncharacterized protein n=1 Tax=Melastoma candidum TaxID=119954 RepID=A0ACB9QSM1_9MYRT|nr:hypothetical protein MLD38_018079 [Melastoma candidum]
MPTRKSKESTEKHIVIKTHLQNSMKEAKRSPRVSQTCKGPPPEALVAAAAPVPGRIKGVWGRPRRTGGGGDEEGVGNPSREKFVAGRAVAHAPAIPSRSCLSLVLTVVGS